MSFHTLAIIAVLSLPPVGMLVLLWRRRSTWLHCPDPPPTSDGLFKVVRWGNYLTGVTLLGIAFSSGAVIWFACYWFGMQVATHVAGRGEALLPPLTLLWGISAIFAGLITAALVMAVSMEAILGRRTPYVEYLYFTLTLQGRPAGSRLPIANAVPMKRLLVAMIGLIALFGLVHPVLVTQWYAVATEQEFVYSDLFSLRERAYSYEEIASVHLVKHWRRFSRNSWQDKEHLQIVFADGVRWSSAELQNQDPAPRALARLVAEKSGKPIQTLDYPGDAPR